MRPIFLLASGLFIGCGPSYEDVVAPYATDYANVRQKLRRIAAMLDSEAPVADSEVLKTPRPLPSFTLVPELSNLSIVNFENLRVSQPYDHYRDWPDFGFYAHNDLFEGLNYVETIDGWRDENYHEAMAEDMLEACQRGLLTEHLLVVRRNTFAQVKQRDDWFVGGTGLFDAFLVDLQDEVLIARLSFAADTSGLDDDSVPASASGEDWDDFVRHVNWRIECSAKELLTVELNKMLGTRLELWAR